MASDKRALISIGHSGQCAARHRLDAKATRDTMIVQYFIALLVFYKDISYMSPKDAANRARRKTAKSEREETTVQRSGQQSVDKTNPAAIVFIDEQVPRFKLG